MGVVDDKGNRLWRETGSMVTSMGLDLDLWRRIAVRDPLRQSMDVQRVGAPVRTLYQYPQTVASRKIALWSVMKVAITMSNSGGRWLTDGTSIDGVLEQQVAGRHDEQRILRTNSCHLLLPQLCTVGVCRQEGQQR